MKEEKKSMIKDLEEKFAGPCVIFTDYQGINNNDMNLMRKALKKVDAQFKVIKNTLAMINLRQLGRTQMEEYLRGPTAVVFGGKDEMEVIRVLAKFSQDYGRPKIKAGLIGQEFFSAEKIEKIAALPSRAILFSLLCREIQSPLQGLYNSLRGLIAGLINILNMKAKQQK